MNITIVYVNSYVKLSVVLTKSEICPEINFDSDSQNVLFNPSPTVTQTQKHSYKYHGLAVQQVAGLQYYTL